MFFHQIFLNYIFSGNDTFNGSGGNDYINIDSGGNDTYNGNAGNDYIGTNVGYSSKVNGGIGNDFIKSYGYGDVLSGGKGADFFCQYDALDASVIKDYSIKDGDMFMSHMSLKLRWEKASRIHLMLTIILFTTLQLASFTMILMLEAALIVLA